MKRAITILLALIIDLTLGDPPNRFHPVVLMGNWLTKGRRLAPRHHRFWFGIGWIVAGAALFALPWRQLKIRNEQLEIEKKEVELPKLCGFRGFIFLLLKLEKCLREIKRAHYALPHLKLLRHLIVSAILLKPVFAYRNLRQSVAEVTTALAANNLSQARRLTGWHLVSRDTSRLTAEEVAGAAIESLAENITDSVTAPLMAYALGGLPAAWAYRFINTADAMWGYHTTEFEQLGKFPAWLDDILNWLPARLTGWLFVASAWPAGEDTGQAMRVMLTQHNRTSSPNAGWAMSAVAGALGVTLSKHGVYQLVGGHQQPDVTAINRALRLADICVGLSVLVIWSGLLIIGNRCKK